MRMNVCSCIEPPSIEELRHRLENRGSDSADSIRQRVDRAEYELGFMPRYDHVVTNDELSRAISEVESIIRDYIKEA